MSRSLPLNRRAFLATAAGALAGVGGCAEPSEEARQNRRLVEAVLTAVTMKNRKELDKDAVLWDKRLADGFLSDKPHKAVKDCIVKAQAGDWSGAEKELYRFRESDPYPR